MDELAVRVSGHGHGPARALPMDLMGRKDFDWRCDTGAVRGRIGIWQIGEAVVDRRKRLKEMLRFLMPLSDRFFRVVEIQCHTFQRVVQVGKIRRAPIVVRGCSVCGEMALRWMGDGVG